MQTRKTGKGCERHGVGYLDRREEARRVFRGNSKKMRGGFKYKSSVVHSHGMKCGRRRGEAVRGEQTKLRAQ